MAPPLQTNNKGSVDNIVKKNTDHQDGETSQPPNLQPDAKKNEELQSFPYFASRWIVKIKGRVRDLGNQQLSIAAPFCPDLNINLLSKSNVFRTMRNLSSSQIKNSKVFPSLYVLKLFCNHEDIVIPKYGKNVLSCMEVKQTKRLMELSSSVCQVRFNGVPVGSGFLLVDKFVLTNAHVVNDFYNETTKQLDGRVTVHFSYEDLQLVGEEVEVEEVVGFELGQDASGHQYDWVLLKLSADKKLPDGLLPEVGFCPQGGAVCIIGHPDGGVKKIDPCLIVPSHDRNNVVERHYYENQRHVQLITELFFERVSETVKCHTQDLTYESCFYFGSSGSPVFDKHCKVVAMHSGGYIYTSLTGTKHSVIEYGHPLSNIIEHILVQMVERGRVDVLKALPLFTP
ncbi:protein FAM111A-like [Mastacembelus armatus]|uniref:Protein FAM111A-like n=1 Tax=Mastacembelus armatus TaxID=205130 RepID=A0A7N8XEZ2_9TELE|nr:protein FAM111A-like [Mastacembelus armatus]